MELTQLLEEKFNNFKFLIADKIKNEENEHFKKIMEYKLDDILFFYESNIKPYHKAVGQDIIVASFVHYLELDNNDKDLAVNIKNYFNFFIDVIENSDGDQKADGETSTKNKEGQGERDTDVGSSGEVWGNESDDLQLHELAQERIKGSHPRTSRDERKFRGIEDAFALEQENRFSLDKN